MIRVAMDVQWEFNASAGVTVRHFKAPINGGTVGRQLDSGRLFDEAGLANSGAELIIHGASPQTKMQNAVRLNGLREATRK